MKSILIALVALIILSGPAHALSTEENGDAATRTLKDFIEDYVDVPKGAMDWKTFGATKEINIEKRDKDGFDLQYYKPGFPDNIKALDGKPVTIKGFMFPMDEADEQTYFLFGPFPVSCPFHYHVGPSLMMEVHTGKKPIRFSYDPVTITGILKLIADDPDNSIFYKLMDARVVK